MVDAWVLSKQDLPLDKKIMHNWRWASMGASGANASGPGQVLSGAAITRLACAVGAHHCVWSRDEGRRQLLAKGHSVRSIHNEGQTVREKTLYRSFFSPTCKNDQVTKTGSGQAHTESCE